MSEYSFLSNPELLLSHGEFVRALAKSLLFDENQVDEVVQKTWLAAIQNPPRNEGSERAWLSRVVRNQAAEVQRKEVRVEKRERAASKPEEIASTAEIVERESARREVIDTVLNLEEPHRTAVLLRFYEDLPPRAIAKRLGVPVETVRTRIKRGLELLREKLDRNHGGDRRAWCLAIIPFAAKSKAAQAAALGGISATILGGVIMGLKTKVVAAIFIAALGAGIFWMSTRPTTDSFPESAKQSATTASAPKEEKIAAVTIEKETVAPPTAPASTETQTPSSRSETSAITQKQPTLWGKVLNEKTGEALSGAKVFLMGLPTPNGEVKQLDELFREGFRREFTADGEGVYRIHDIEEGVYFLTAPTQKIFAFTLTAVVFVGEKSSQNFRANLKKEEMNAMMATLGIPEPKLVDIQPDKSTEISIALREGGRIEGRVLSSAGTPIAGAKVITLPGILLLMLDRSGPEDMRLGEIVAIIRKLAGPLFPETKSSSDGSFVIDGALGSLGLIASAPKHFMNRAITEGKAGGSTKVELVLEPNPTEWSIYGKVVDDRGEGIPNAKVYLTDEKMLHQLELMFSFAALDSLDRPVAITKKDGSFAFEKISGFSAMDWNSEKDPEETSFKLIAVTENSMGKSNTIEISDRLIENVVIKISTQSKLAGTVIDADTQLPIQNASIQIWVRSENGGGSHSSGNDIKTDSQGHFISQGEFFSGTKLGLHVQAEGYHNDSIGIRTEKGKWSYEKDLFENNDKTQEPFTSEKEVRIRLKRTSWIVEGTVLSPSGLPVPQFGYRGKIPYEAFALSAYKKDPKSSLVSSSYSYSGGAGILVRNTETTEDAENTSESCTYDSTTGRFKFAVPENWPKDRVWIALFTFDQSKPLIREVSINSGDVHFVINPDLEDKTAKLSLLITDRVKGNVIQKKIPWLTAWKKGKDGSRPERLTSMRSYETELILTQIESGSYDLIVSMEGYATGILENIEVTKGAEIGPLSIALGPEAKVHVKLEGVHKDATTSKDGWWSAAAYDSANRIVWSSAIFPNDDDFDIEGLSSGSYRVVVTNAKMKEVSAQFQAVEGMKKEISMPAP